MEFIRLTLEDVLITYASYNGSLFSPMIPVLYSFQAAKITQQYWEQADNGIRGAEVSSGWDIKQNKAI